jgi:hypothetical protein
MRVQIARRDLSHTRESPFSRESAVVIDLRDQLDTSLISVTSCLMLTGRVDQRQTDLEAIIRDSPWNRPHEMLLATRTVKFRPLLPSTAFERLQMLMPDNTSPISRRNLHP